VAAHFSHLLLPIWPANYCHCLLPYGPPPSSYSAASGLPTPNSLLPMWPTHPHHTMGSLHGFMENVHGHHTCILTPTHSCPSLDYLVGLGKSVLWYSMCHTKYVMANPFNLSPSSTIIEATQVTFNTGPALMAYYYFNCRDTSKQGICDLLTSLLSQLCAKSNHCNWF
jgi:hypothetical protein